MNIKLDICKYDDKTVQLLGIMVDIYAKTDAQAKEIAKKIIDIIPEPEYQNLPEGPK